MNILVIGGAGYIGSYMCKLLYKNGYNVFILDNLSTGFEKLARYGELIIGDMSDSNILDDIFSKHNIQAVFHFAAFSIVGESTQNPLKYYKNNVSGTINLLESMIKHNINKIIFSSTAAIFGNPEYTPINESHPKNPINPYGKSKLMVENILQDLALSNGLSSICLRYFNACGADPEGELGELHNPETHLIPLVLKTALNKRDEITIFGTDYETKDGTCIRDYIHIKDLCNAHLLSLNFLNNNKGCFNFNLGNGEGFSVKEIIENTESILNKEINKKIGNKREGDPSILIADSSSARNILGWKPEITDISLIIKDALEWESKN